MTQELSTQTVEDILPQNFDKLSLKKQKQIVVLAFQDHLIEMNSAIQREEELKLQIKNLAAKIRLSKEAKDLAGLRREEKQGREDLKSLFAERSGMLRVTKKLGFDIKEELKKMKLIEE